MRAAGAHRQMLEALHRLGFEERRALEAVVTTIGSRYEDSTLAKHTAFLLFAQDEFPMVFDKRELKRSGLAVFNLEKRIPHLASFYLSGRAITDPPVWNNSAFCFLWNIGWRSLPCYRDARLRTWHSQIKPELDAWRGELEALLRRHRELRWAEGKLFDDAFLGEPDEKAMREYVADPLAWCRAGLGADRRADVAREWRALWNAWSEIPLFGAIRKTYGDWSVLENPRETRLDPSGYVECGTCGYAIERTTNRCPRCGAKDRWPASAPVSQEP
jgi:hypothetical protein